MRPRAALVLAALCVSATASAASCPHCGQTYSENYPPGSPQKALDRQRHEASCAGRGSGASGPSLSPADQMTLDLMGTAAQWAGSELHKMLWGDPAENARKAEEARIRAAEEARLRAEQEAAAARRREELHANLMRALKLTGAGEVALKGFDGAGEGGGLKLKLSDDVPGPKGTSFFGTGGGDGGKGPAEGHGDPRVVDLRDLRRGAYLVQQAEAASPGDAAILLEDALDAAAGGGPAIPLERCPEVGEQGLLDFQKANRDYRLARTTGADADAKYRATLRDVDLARREAALRRIDAEAMEDPDGSRKAAFRDALKRLKELQEARERDRARAEAARAEASLLDALRRRMLRLAARPDPEARATYAETLRAERERLQPSLEARARRYVLKDSTLPAEEAVIDRLRSDYRPAAPEIEALKPSLQRAVDRLVAASPYPDDRIEVVLVGMPRDPARASGMESNACAYSTRVAVGERFLKDWQARGADEDELAFVLGHEVVHAQNDHWTVRADRVRRTALPEGIRYPDVTEAEFQLMPPHQQREVVEVFRARGAVQDAWRGLQFRDLNRGQESEADRGAMTLVLAAGYRPDGPRRSFAWLSEAEKADAPKHAAARAFHEASADHAPARTRFADLQRIWGRALGEPPP